MSDFQSNTLNFNFIVKNCLLSLEQSKWAQYRNLNNNNKNNNINIIINNINDNKNTNNYNNSSSNYEFGHSPQSKTF
jgi:hypothetical protein